jgi:hypothetical protein
VAHIYIIDNALTDKSLQLHALAKPIFSALRMTVSRMLEEDVIGK